VRAGVSFWDIGRRAACWQRRSACAAGPGVAGGTRTAAGRAPATTVSGDSDIILWKINRIILLSYFNF